MSFKEDYLEFVNSLTGNELLGLSSLLDSNTETHITFNDDNDDVIDVYIIPRAIGAQGIALEDFYEEVLKRVYREHDCVVAESIVRYKYNFFVAYPAEDEWVDVRSCLENVEINIDIAMVRTNVFGHRFVNEVRFLRPSGMDMETLQRVVKSIAARTIKYEVALFEES